jgi:hypothetical protein
MPVFSLSHEDDPYVVKIVLKDYSKPLDHPERKVISWLPSGIKGSGDHWGDADKIADYRQVGFAYHDTNSVLTLAVPDVHLPDGLYTVKIKIVKPGSGKNGQGYGKRRDCLKVHKFRVDNSIGMIRPNRANENENEDTNNTPGIPTDSTK